VLEIKSHKFILASRSGKFRDLLKSNLIKLNQNQNIQSKLASSVTSSTTCSCHLKHKTQNSASPFSSSFNPKATNYDLTTLDSSNVNTPSCTDISLSQESSPQSGDINSESCFSPNCIKKPPVIESPTPCSSTSASTSSSSSSDSSGFYDLADSPISGSPCSCSCSTPGLGKTNFFKYFFCSFFFSMSLLL
jgi:hypothetical protein